MIRYVQDEVFGAVEVYFEEGVVRIAGEGLPTVEIVRSGERQTSDVPIGTRDPERLSMTVGGLEALIRPESVGLTRRSQAVDAHVEDEVYRVRPVSDCSNEVESKEGEGWRLEGEVFTLSAVAPSWEERATPTAAAVGYALSAAFGTGSVSTLWNALAFIGI